MTERDEIFLSALMMACLPEQERLRVWNEYPETGSPGEREFRMIEHFRGMVHEQYKYFKSAPQTET